MTSASQAKTLELFLRSFHLASISNADEALAVLAFIARVPFKAFKKDPKRMCWEAVGQLASENFIEEFYSVLRTVMDNEDLPGTVQQLVLELAQIKDAASREQTDEVVFLVACIRCRPLLYEQSGFLTNLNKARQSSKQAS